MMRLLLVPLVKTTDVNFAMLESHLGQFVAECDPYNCCFGIEEILVPKVLTLGFLFILLFKDTF